MRTRRGAKEVWRIVLAPHETKTRSPYEAELPVATAALFSAYLARYRPLLVMKNSQFLFPGRSEASRNRSNFGSALSKFIARETGLEMHPHLFRHLAAMLHLDMHPQQIETVRMVLGHSSTRMTLKAYAELSTDPAMRAYSATVETLRSKPRRRRAAASERRSGAWILRGSHLPRSAAILGAGAPAGPGRRAAFAYAMSGGRITSPICPDAPCAPPCQPRVCGGL